jgi:hypothetical protein
MSSLSFQTYLDTVQCHTITASQPPQLLRSPSRGLQWLHHGLAVSFRLPATVAGIATGRIAHCEYDGTPRQESV